LNKIIQQLVAFRVLLIISIFSMVVFYGCSSEDKKVSEGVLEFKIQYPYYTDGFMQGLLPNTMVMTFKDDKYKIEIAKGKMFASTLMSDCKNKTLTIMLDFGPKKIYTVLDEQQTFKYVNDQFSEPEVYSMNYMDTLAGFKCEKHYAVFDDLVNGHDVELMSTNQILLTNSNWCNQYRSVPGVLLQYELEQYGLVMNFRATEFKGTKVESSVFDIPAGFKEVTLEKMLYEMQEIFSTLNY
jgi:hypothetical protein